MLLYSPDVYKIEKHFLKLSDGSRWMVFGCVPISNTVELRIISYATSNDLLASRRSKHLLCHNIWHLKNDLLHSSVLIADIHRFTYNEIFTRMLRAHRNSLQNMQTLRRKRVASGAGNLGFSLNLWHLLALIQIELDTNENENFSSSLLHQSTLSSLLFPFRNWSVATETKEVANIFFFLVWPDFS